MLTYGGDSMTFCYNRLWKLLIDRNLKKTELLTIARIISITLAKLGRNENVTTDVLLKICSALGCDIKDIAEVTEKRP